MLGSARRPRRSCATWYGAEIVLPKEVESRKFNVEGRNKRLAERWGQQGEGAPHPPGISHGYQTPGLLKFDCRKCMKTKDDTNEHPTGRGNLFFHEVAR